MTPEETQRTLSGLNPATGGTGIRNLQLQSGDPASLLGNTTTASQGLGTTSRLSSGAYQKFIMQVMELLKQSQGLGTKPFEEQALGLQEEQVRRAMEPATPGMSPSQQSAIRQADVGAVEPSISGVTKRAQTFSEQLRGFGTSLDQAVALGGFLNQKAQTDKQEARDLVLNFPDAITKMEEKQAKELFSQAGIPWDLKDSLITKTKEEKWSDPYTLVSGDLAIRNDKTGDIKVISKASEKVGKQLPSNQVVMLSDSAFLPGVLDDLKSLIETNADLFGPTGKVKGFFQRTQLGTTEDDLRRASQLVGKFMEGGVLRKEDELKYEKMLPNLKDWNSQVALDKLDGVKKMLEKKYDGYVKSFQSSGYDVSGFQDNPFGKTGEIPVRVIDTGETGWIPEIEFDPSIYEKITL